MTSIDEHKKKIAEHMEEIEDAILQGIEKKPITIGFNCSACALQFLELYLHLTNQIPIGKIIKHDWFKKPKLGQMKEPLIERKLGIDFKRKEEIYGLLYELEDGRNSLVYGKVNEKQIRKVIDLFNKLKEIFMEMYKNEGFEI